VTPVVLLRAVGRVYPGPPPVVALRSVDLTIDRGEYLAIVGPSGSGKSTLLNVLGLLDRPTSGRFELDGFDMATRTEAERTALRAGRIGFVFQAFHLLPYRTAVENVALALLYAGTRRRQRDRLAAEALDRVGLARRRDSCPNEMSGGERQRVAIARALVTQPSLLLCDEPTGNLDSATAATVLDLVADLHRDGMTVAIITHDPVVAARAARVVAIRDGEVCPAPRVAV
jgi:putative ABC transport system ATP-binding protein